MSNDDKQLSKLIEDAKIKYNEYLQTQKDFQIPQAHISIDKELDETTKVHIEIEYKEIKYKFESIEEKDTDNIYQYLNSQSSVRQKYADGNVTNLQSTITRVNTLTERFRNKNSPLYLYSGFVVYDYETEIFLGMANLGGGIQIGTSEIAFLNRSQCWSHPLNNIHFNNNKIYSGLGTVETSTLLQYATKLKQQGYLVNGHQLKSIVATARVDNEGSWKSCAKIGMILDDIDVVQRYGNKLRYQLTKHISNLE
jgi:hypothetical protein